MLLLLMEIVQPAAPISEADPPRLTETPCKPGADLVSGDIVVCGKPSRTYRIGPVEPPGPAIPPAAVKLSDNVAAKIGVEQQDIGGFPSNRVMLSFEIRF
jgi:hypothetical protein